jgi:hypothetical protein
MRKPDPKPALRIGLTILPTYANCIESDSALGAGQEYFGVRVANGITDPANKQWSAESRKPSDFLYDEAFSKVGRLLKKLP